VGAFENDVMMMLHRIAADVAELKGSAGKGNGGQRGYASRGGKVATDSDLDGQHGDPEVRFDPRDWKGRQYVGYRFSQTDPEYLDVMAESLDSYATYCEDGSDEKKRGTAKYKRLDAARARGWAARLRAHPAKPPQTQTFGGSSVDDEIPF
jgi:hypothetical protein